MNSSPFSTLDPQRQKLAYQRAAERVYEVESEAPSKIQALKDAIASKTTSNRLRASVPSIFHPIFSSKKYRYKGARGGRGSAKSWSFATALIDKCNNEEGTRAVCVREVQRSLEQSVKRLLEDTIQRFDLGRRFNVLNTHIETPGDGVIIFQGMQNHTAESIKSLEGYDLAWVEEAQSLSERSLTLLRPTIRKVDSEIWLTWNPRHASDPVDVFFSGENIPPNALLLKANYSDNPFLPETLRLEMEWDRNRDKDKYEHIWLGGYERATNARVFSNWRVEDFDTPEDAYLLFGGDFGFSVDPTVLVRCFIVDRNLYIDGEVYKVGCEIDDTPTLWDMIPGSRNWTIIADCARPETISYLQRHGFPLLEAATKGKNSVEEGISFLKNYNIIVHSRCIHTIDELTMYAYKTHPLTGDPVPILSDKKNHVIDSLRYAVEKVRQPQETEEWVSW